MNRDYLFREIKKEEIPQMFSMILQRIEWMDRQGIEQWNKTGYIQAYPQSYYEEEREKGEVFVLADRSTGELVSAAVLKEMDERWTDDRPALYLHNFVSRIAVKNAGSIFLYFVEKYALKKGKKYLRLDSAEDNPILAQYYESHGFMPVGKCEDGLYKGILREKELREHSVK